MLKKRKNFIIGAAAVVLVLIITLPIFIGLVSKPIKKPGTGSSNMKIFTKFEVLESNINWAENAYSLSLNSGKIVTNVPVSRIFVNANGVGTQDLDYTVNEVKTQPAQKLLIILLNLLKISVQRLLTAIPPLRSISTSFSMKSAIKSTLRT